jgi:hypothetical protein
MIHSNRKVPGNYRRRSRDTSVAVARGSKSAKSCEMNLHRRQAAFALLLVLSSCSSDASDTHDHPSDQDISNVIYVGGVTDEALKRLLDATPKEDQAQALVVGSPDLSAPLPADQAATFEFHLASTAKRAPLVPILRGQSRPSTWQRSFHELVQFLTPVRTAHAHGAPFNGTAYYLVVSDADSKSILQVFTTETSFTPEAVDWQNLVQARQPLTLTITSAFFEANDVPTGGGPFVGGRFPFRIE